MEEKLYIRVTGMTCVLCSTKIENKLKKLEGIKSATVNFSSEVATVIYDSEECNRDKIYNTITKLGFYIDDEEGNASKKYVRDLKIKVILSILLLLPLMFIMFLCGAIDCCIKFDIGTGSWFTKTLSSLRYQFYFLHNWKLQAIIAFIIQFIIGNKFYTNAIYSIKNKMPGMDLLIALGTLSTYGLSLYSGLNYENDYGRSYYFESGAMIVTFVLLGKYLEALARKKTCDSVNELAKLQPDNAKVITSEGIKVTKIDDINKEDIVLINPGESIPLDGTIVSGETSVNESMITGESRLNYRTVGDTVIGGTLNVDGSIQFKVDKVLDETILASIIRAVEDAQGHKPQIQKIVDKVSKVFVPIVILLAIITFSFWYFYVFGSSVYFIEKPIIYAISVLVISCPCALGLAIPTSISISTGIAAKRGILVRNGQALEDARKINAIVFDKTGTLTVGKPKIVNITQVNPSSKIGLTVLLKYAASIERNSEHPLGKAIVEEAINRNISLKEVNKFISYTGKGVKGEIDDTHVIIGSLNLILENGIKVDFEESEEFSYVYIAINDVLEGVMVFYDEIKDDAKETIGKLIGRGIDVIMLTGDSIAISNYVAKHVGIEKVYSNVLPEEKSNILNKLKLEKKFVAMVGDGINDAVALTNSDIAFSIGAGADIAIQSSDIVIVGDDIKSIITTIDLSKKTMTKIKSNLFLALIYNTIAIPFAAFGYLSPVVAAGCMALSSISVVLNSLSLKRFKVYS